MAQETADLRYIEDRSGNVFFPVTHISAVVDGNGHPIDTILNATERTTNKVTSLSSSSTDTQYPSAKCVYDLLGDVETLINAL